METKYMIMDGKVRKVKITKENRMVEFLYATSIDNDGITYAKEDEFFAWDIKKEELFDSAEEAREKLSWLE